MWCVWLNCLLCLLLRPDDDILNRKSLSILQIPPTILFPLLFSTLLKSNHTSVRVSPALYYCLLSHQLLTKTKIDHVVTVIYDLINYIHTKGAFSNYADKRRQVGGQQKVSSLGNMNKRQVLMQYVKMSTIVHLSGVGGHIWVTFGSRSY